MSLRRRGRQAPAVRPIRWPWFAGFAGLGLARLVDGCGKWVALGAGLELLSILGYILVFALVFCARMSKRQSLGAALRALGATTVLPAGGLVGPAMGVRATCAGRPPLGLVRSTLAFTLLT